MPKIMVQRDSPYLSPLTKGVALDLIKKLFV